MKLISHKILIGLVFVTLLTFIAVNALYLYNINIKMETSFKQKEELTALLRLDKDLNLVFTKKIGYKNVDDANAKLKKFQQVLDEMKGNGVMQDYFTYPKNVKIFEETKSQFQTKRLIIRKYLAHDTITNNSLKYLMDSYASLQLKNSAKQRAKIQHIFLQIMEYRLGEKIDTIKFEKELSSMLASDINRQNYSYLKHVQITFKYMKSATELEKKNFDLQLSKYTRELNYNFNQYVRLMMDYLFRNMVIFILLIIMFGGFIFWLISRNQSKTKELLQFRHAVQNSDNSVVMTDTKHRILYVNKTFEKATGYSKKEVLGKTPAVLKSGMHNKEFYDEIKKSIKHKKGWSGEFINRSKTGEIIYEKASIFPIYDDKDVMYGYLAIKLDITEEKAHLVEIENKNVEILTKYQIDERTGVWSRNVLEDELLKKSNGYLIYLKISNFSDIRFYYGNKIANAVVQNVAENLKRFITIYHIRGQILRVGEDDFCIWYKHKKPSRDLLKAILEYIKENQAKIDNTTYIADVKMGVSSHEDLPNSDRLLQGLIAYLNGVKNGTLFEYYKKNNELELTYRRNITITQKIRNAINNNLVGVECQPIYHSKSKQLYSYEVLMRMRDEDGKMMYPNEFLDVAKQTSLYTILMHKVIDNVFELLNKHEKKHFSINMSVVDMVDESTTKIFLDKLSKCKNPRNLTIEVLESEGVENYDTIKPFLDQAKSYGCLLSIDDFGSGYSNYARILQLQIDQIKIDGSIIKQLPYDENSRIIVETIIGIARRKKCKIVAEFVCDEKIYEIVKEYGIEYSQGFLLGKPRRLDDCK